MQLVQISQYRDLEAMAVGVELSYDLWNLDLCLPQPTETPARAARGSNLSPRGIMGLTVSAQRQCAMGSPGGATQPMGHYQASHKDISPHGVELQAAAALWTLLYRLNKCLSREF